jgi:hypothetical protein
LIASSFFDFSILSSQLFVFTPLGICDRLHNSQVFGRV